MQKRFYDFHDSYTGEEKSSENWKLIDEIQPVQSQ